MLLSAWLPSISHAAESRYLALCDAGVATEQPQHLQEFFSADGKPQQLTITTERPAPSCHDMELPASGAILWAGLVPEELLTDDLRNFVLQGNFSNGRPLVSEVLTNAAPVASTRELPLNQSVADLLKPQPFGIDERVTMTSDTTLVCAPGSAVAGAILRPLRPWPAGDALRLEMKARGTGTFPIGIGNPELDRLQNPHALGEQTPERQQSTQFSADLPNTGQPWTSVTIVCPAGGGELQIEELGLYTAGTANVPVTGAWMWSPAIWKEAPAFIWRMQEEQKFDELYISVPVSSAGTVETPQALSDFITEARTRGLKIWAVIGDPRDVLPASMPALQQRLAAYVNYNRTTPDAAKLAGVQLDIEPYLLPGFAMAQEHWRERYVAVIGQAHQRLQAEMLLDLVMPAWWGNHPHWGQALLQQLPRTNTSITIMNYHTDPQRLRENAEPFLSWAQSSRVPIRIGLESGGLADETQRRYLLQPDTGELWLMSLGNQSALVLFEQPQQTLQGRSFQFLEQTIVPSRRYTFAGDFEQLREIVAPLQSEWSAWSSFSGIAIHGLDEFFLKEQSAEDISSAPR